MGCWDPSCQGHVKNRGLSNKSSVSVRRIDVRSVEDIDQNGFLCHPTFICNKHGKNGSGATKSAMDFVALLEMGVPVYMIRRYNFIVLSNSIFTKRLMELINSLMTGE